MFCFSYILVLMICRVWVLPVGLRIQAVIAMHWLRGAVGRMDSAMSLHLTKVFSVLLLIRQLVSLWVGAVVEALIVSGMLHSMNARPKIVMASEMMQLVYWLFYRMKKLVRWEMVKMRMVTTLALGFVIGLA